MAQTAPQGAASPLIVLALAALIAYAVWRRWPSAWRWLGRLPGDLRLQRGQTTLYVPLASALVVSLALSALIGVASWALGVLGPLLAWFGNLPGDIVVRRDSFTLYAPIASLLLLSLVVSALLALLRWLLPRRGGRRR